MDNVRWHKMDIFHQLGNIGSEIHRLRVWQDKGDNAALQVAFELVLNLIDSTAQDPKWLKGGRLKELLRLRECLGDCVLSTQRYGVTLKELDEYCLAYALVARRA